ncbi:sensor histidine kinase [Janibacter limosus]|uniref:histidine kinase n=1 Tax=Janibacter limosus TaxID=53458 RepID=A0A4P6MYM7_9MICO|nr:histidine kinase [Janibacter limosus]QBF46753.1 hypothetical protein EXU32_11150 [Janibacter limosus]
MITGPVTMAMVMLAVSLIGSGTAMLRLGRARVAGGVLVLTGAGLLVACVLESTGLAEGARIALFATALLLAPLAVVAYPRFDVRSPVEFVVLIVVIAAGAMGALVAVRTSVQQAMVLIILLALIGLVWWRLEHAVGPDRWALSWCALGAGSGVLGAGVASFAAPNVSGAVLAVVLLCLVGPAMYVGAVHPDLVDVRGVAVHVVVAVTASVGYVAAFVGLAAFLELLAGGQPSVGVLGIIGAGLAATFQPARQLLRGVIDELLFGSRPDPLGVAGEVADQVGDDPLRALHVIRHAMVLPYVAVRMNGAVVAESGTEVMHTRVLALGTAHAAQAGSTHSELVVGLRPGDLGMSPADEQVLHLVVPLLAQTLRARGLAADLQSSREQTITGIEEERRRLRRDLHDGMGPRLSGIAFIADAALNSVRTDPTAAEGHLRFLRTETVGVIEDIRDLVYAMRPPALDELGLVPAIRQHASTLRSPDGAGIEVSVWADACAPLTAAAEVAAYRIVVEALANVARHSGASAASVRLTWAVEGVVIEVRDNGGPGSTWTSGIGLASMRERAAELGGTLLARPDSSGGVVIATLPRGPSVMIDP